MIRALVILALVATAAWALTPPGGVIALLFVAAVLYLAYKRLSLLAYTVTFFVLLAAYTALGAPAGAWKGALWLMFAGLAFLNIRPIRKALADSAFKGPTGDTEPPSPTAQRFDKCRCPPSLRARSACEPC